MKTFESTINHYCALKDSDCLNEQDEIDFSTSCIRTRVYRKDENRGYGLTQAQKRYRQAYYKQLRLIEIQALRAYSIAKVFAVVSNIDWSDFPFYSIKLMDDCSYNNFISAIHHKYMV